MTFASKGSARGRFPFFKFRLGFTLAELLAVLFIAGILSGSLMFVYKPPSPAQAVEREARNLSRWLTNLTTISNRTGRSFLLDCPTSVKREYVEAEWRTPFKKDVYTSLYECEFNRHASGNQGNQESVYSPKWGFMTPAITIKVSREDAEHYVIVSRRGRVRTSGSPWDAGS